MMLTVLTQNLVNRNQVANAIYPPPDFSDVRKTVQTLFAVHPVKQWRRQFRAEKKAGRRRFE
jgi:hypothetical protein